MLLPALPVWLDAQISSFAMVQAASASPYIEIWQCNLHLVKVSDIHGLDHQDTGMLSLAR